jgi:hypothetical protein
MKQIELNDLLDRVHAWPKEAQRAAFDSLSAIEQECHISPAFAEDLMRSRDDLGRTGRGSERDNISL